MVDRRKMGSKDMAMAMVVVLAVVGLIALYGGNVSFAPGATPQEGEPPTANVQAGFGHAAATLSFVVTVPDGIPPDWHPNSFSVSDPSTTNVGVTEVGSLPAVRGGWITPSGAFITLVEAAGSPDQVVAGELGESRAVTGTVQAGGAEWTVTTGMRDEAAWLRSDESATGMTTFLITGDADETDFRVLAAAVAD